MAITSYNCGVTGKGRKSDEKLEPFSHSILFVCRDNVLCHGFCFGPGVGYGYPGTDAREHFHVVIVVPKGKAILQFYFWVLPGVQC